jgi:hypothetical protein
VQPILSRSLAPILALALAVGGLAACGGGVSATDQCVDADAATITSYAKDHTPSGGDAAALAASMRVSCATAQAVHQRLTFGGALELAADDVAGGGSAKALQARQIKQRYGPQTACDTIVNDPEVQAIGAFNGVPPGVIRATVVPCVRANGLRGFVVLGT